MTYVHFDPGKMLTQGDARFPHHKLFCVPYHIMDAIVRLICNMFVIASQFSSSLVHLNSNLGKQESNHFQTNGFQLQSIVILLIRQECWIIGIDPCSKFISYRLFNKLYLVQV